MKYRKGFIVPLLLALIALIFIGGGVYMHQKQENQLAVITSATQSTSTTQLQDSSDKILLGERGYYRNLSIEEKGILESNNNDWVRKSNDELKKYGLDPTLYADESLVTSAFLKYYDSTKILVGRFSIKGTPHLYLVDRKDWKVIGENIDSLWTGGGYVESNGYAISVGTDSIFYYKVGDSTISSVPNSSELAEGETYQESPGMGGGNYTIAFDEPTKTLTVTVYHGDLYGNGNGQKIRTVKFVLP